MLKTIFGDSLRLTLSTWNHPSIHKKWESWLFSAYQFCSPWAEMKHPVLLLTELTVQWETQAGNPDFGQLDSDISQDLAQLTIPLQIWALSTLAAISVPREHREGQLTKIKQSGLLVEENETQTRKEEVQVRFHVYVYGKEGEGKGTKRHRHCKLRHT